MQLDNLVVLKCEQCHDFWKIQFIVPDRQHVGPLYANEIKYIKNEFELLGILNNYFKNIWSWVASIVMYRSIEYQIE